MALTIGTQLGSHEITALLGKGGMGEVYRARDLKLKREVAIKILPDDLCDAAARRRFQQEAQMASSLNHPHILSVYDVGEVDDKQYLVMEYIDGGTLRDWGRREMRSWRQVIDLMTGVADALATAHAANILHRDIKPENILVSKSGYGKLADFGLAKLEEGKDVHDASTLTAGATRPGTMMGTIPYMSPEQALGRNVDMRSDIFSFGSVLYELISGQPPFTGRSDLETLQKVIDHSPEPLPEAVPVMVRNVIEKALEKDPSERYQSMREMAVDLKRLARRKDQGSKQPAASNGWRRTMAVAAALVIVIAVAAMLLLRNRDRADDNPLANAQFTRFTDFEGTESDAAISPDGRFVAFRSDRDGPVDTWVSQVGSGRFINLTHGTQGTVAIKNTGFTPDGSEIWLSALIGGNRLRLIPLLGGNPRVFLSEHAINVAWSPDGSRVVFHTYDTGDPLFVADRSGGNAQQIFTLNAGGHNHFPTWSRDGQWIYFISGLWDASKEMDVFRIRPSGGMPERLTDSKRDIRYLAPLDNRTLLYTSPDQNGAGPWLWALDTAQKTSRRISSGLEVYSSVDASGDGRRLAVTVSNPTANLWSLPILDKVTEENDIKSVNLPTVRAHAPRYGGNSLFYLSSNGGGDGLWRYENGQASEIWRGVDGALFEPAAISPDGRRVAVILQKQGKRTLQTLSADGGDVRALAPAIDVTSAASWSPDGNFIVAGGVDEKGQGLFKIPVDGGPAVRLANGTASNPVWSPDGSIIVYTGAVVGVTGPLLMVRENGTSVEAPSIQVRTGMRYRFLPGKQQLVYLPGSQVARENFMLLDLSTKSNRQLSNFDTRLTRTFDITPDGKQIVFDRLREKSDIVLIDLAK
jgi:serine/threonine protein kinase